MRILITGNMGYIGPVVADRLRQQFPGCELVGFDIGYFAGCLVDELRFPETALNEQHFGDIRNFPRRLFAGVECVVHLAGISNEPAGQAFAAPTMAINAEATAEIAAAAKAGGVHRFVFASSCSVYGAGGGDAARSETDTPNPLTAYASSKLRAEHELAKLASDDFTVTCLRFGTACGMSPRLRLDLVVNDLAASAVLRRKVEVLSNGTPWRPVIHVQDMARAFEWAIFRQRENGGELTVVNAGADEWNYRIRELAEAVCAVVPDAELTIAATAPAEKRSYRVDFRRFRELAPNHQPNQSLRGTIEEVVAGVQPMLEGGTTFRTSRLIRLHVLGELRARGELSEALEWRTRPAVEN
jgi:nucleoside-diphosphate-sugar epimerase